MRGNLLAAGRFLKRWRGFAIPLGLVLIVTVFTVGLHGMQSDDVSDHDFLNPASQAAVGAATLSGRLADHGVSIIRETSANRALIAAESGDATLFIPAPSLLNGHQLEFLTLLPGTVRLVIAAADGNTLRQTDFPISRVASRWSTRVAAPGCGDPTANAAGDAGVDGIEYSGDVDACYHGSLAQLRSVDPQVWLAGASDVFRNDRIGEAGNETLAVGLLDTHPRLIWLDIHDPEPPPLVETAPPGESQSPDVVNAGGGVPGGGSAGHQNSSGDNGNDNQADQSPQQSISALFPPWTWTTIGLVALIMLVLALAAARRMGPPITEPMPVTARLRESVEGRGRLYRRAKQPAVALDVLRRAAINQLPAQLGVPATTPVAVMLDLVAERTGLSRKIVDDVLRDGRPRTNADLVTATQRLDDLMTVLAGSVGPTTTHTNRTDLT